MLPSFLLSLALSLSGATVATDTDSCKAHDILMGEYVLATKTINMCQKNILAAEQDPEEVLRHEMVHLAQHNFGVEEGPLFLHEPVLTWLVRGIIPDGETMAVLMNYDGDTDAEFEARILAKLPTPFISGLVTISTFPSHLTSFLGHLAN